MTTEDLEAKAKQIADKLIDMSSLLEDKLHAWSNDPENLKQTEVAGFINKENGLPGVDMVVDVQAPESTKEALVRTFAIECYLDENGNERFNNIQLYFSVDYETGSKFTKDYESATREAIRTLMHRPDVKLKRIIVSNQTGRDQKSQELLGERYDFNLDDAIDQEQVSKVSAALDVVLPALQKSAAAEVRTITED